MVNLLHLSDLHFGFDRDATARKQRESALNLLLRQVSALTKEWRPNLLIISGDLTWQGKPTGYRELGDWLVKSFLPAAGLTAADCVICPGNHDIDRKKAIPLLDRTDDPERADAVLRFENLEDGFARPFAEFVKFADSFGIARPDTGHLVGIRETCDIRFVCLNSAWFCRDSGTDRGKLWLGLPQLQAMPLMDPEDHDTAAVTIALVHHPSEWFANSELTSYDHRPNAYEYLAWRTHIILSGHTHGPIASPHRVGGALIFRGGATYDNAAYRNNFSLFQVDVADRTIVRRTWEFDPRETRWEPKAESKYSLRAERLGRDTRNSARYLSWLREKTQFIDLHQLKVGPTDTPPPAIDLLYAKLMTGTGLHEGEEVKQADPVILEEALRNRKLVIEGKPGAGKTTFVRRVAWILCSATNPPSGFPLRGFPLWVRISQLDEHITNTLSNRHRDDPTKEADVRWIAHFLGAQGWDLDEAFFREKLEARDTVLLLDGLDEATNQQRREKIVEIIVLTAQFPCHIVVTTRPGADEGRAALTGFEKALIEDLDDAGIDAFLLQWCRWLKRGEETAARAYYEEIRPAVAVPGLHILARNPLMLTALSVLHLRRHRLPDQRAQLYEQIMQWLADQAIEKHPRYLEDDLLGRFGTLALAMQEWNGGQKLQIGIETAAHLLTPKGQPADSARHFLEQAQIDSGIVTFRGGEIAFWHLSFQEYLAARKLSGFPDAKLWEQARIFLYSPEGREVLPLLAGHMAESARERLDELFTHLTRDAVAQTELERKAHAAGALGNMLADVASARYSLKGPAERQFSELRDAVMVIFEKGQTEGIGLNTRIAAAEALDRVNPKRLLSPREPDYWIEIGGGEATIGDPAATQGLPIQILTIRTFSIGRFPVTVWEYSIYLRQTGAKPPQNWDEQKLHHSRPVVFLAWRDAQRYCDWANCKLPTSEQWEFAARGTESRIFPWGSTEPDDQKANFNDRAGEPTPVGLFPDGNTPEGVSDLAGNVWEWTSSPFDERADIKALRGASYAASMLRAGVRGWWKSIDGAKTIGFRCVRE